MVWIHSGLGAWVELIKRQQQQQQQQQQKQATSDAVSVKGVGIFNLNQHGDRTCQRSVNRWVSNQRREVFPFKE